MESAFTTQITTQIYSTVIKTAVYLECDSIIFPLQSNFVQTSSEESHKIFDHKAIEILALNSVHFIKELDSTNSNIQTMF